MPNNYTLYKNSFPSSDGKTKIAYYMCMPNRATPRNVVQIVSRIDGGFKDCASLAEYLCARGYVVCGHDHVGSGESLSADGVKGYFARRDGEKILVEDTMRMTALIRQNMEGLSVVMAGEGAGALIAETIMRYAAHGADGYIISGTARSDRFLKKLRRISKRRSKFSGGIKNDGRLARFVDKKICKENKRLGFEPRAEFGAPKLTNRGYHDLTSLIEKVSGEKVLSYVKKDIPLLLIENGRRAENADDQRENEVYSRYISEHMTDVRMICISNSANAKNLLSPACCESIYTWMSESNL